jgi:hypothetical protein
VVCQIAKQAILINQWVAMQRNNNQIAMAMAMLHLYRNNRCNSGKKGFKRVWRLPLPQLIICVPSIICT